MKKSDPLLCLPYKEKKYLLYGYFNIFTWWINFDFPKSEFANTISESKYDKYSPDAPFAVFAHELTHYCQTVASPAMIRLAGDFQIMFMVSRDMLRYHKNAEAIFIPLSPNEESPYVEFHNEIKYPETILKISLLDIIESEALYYQHFLNPPKNFDLSDPSIDLFNKTLNSFNVSSKYHHYANAFLVAQKYLRNNAKGSINKNAIYILFPYITSFAIYYAHNLYDAQDKIYRSVPELFLLALEYFCNNNTYLANELTTKGPKYPNQMFSVFINEICNDLKLKRIPPDENLVTRIMLDLRREFGADIETIKFQEPHWYLLKSVNDRISTIGSMLGSGYQDFLFPLFASNFENLKKIIGLPPLLFSNASKGNWELLISNDIGESIQIHGMLMDSIIRMFYKLIDRHICPHVNCKYYKIGLCKRWYLFPSDMSSNCEFPKVFRKFSGINLDIVNLK